MKRFETRVLKKNEFTLIELLVVVAIIAVLAGILLPALSSAKRKAKSVLCMSNQKQTSVTYLLYADDYNGIMPARDNAAGDGTPYGERWAFSGIYLLAGGYVAEGQGEAYTCTEADEDNNSNYDSGFWAHSTFGFNSMTYTKYGDGWESAMLGDAKFETSTDNTEALWFIYAYHVPKPDDMLMLIDSKSNGVAKSAGYFHRGTWGHSRPVWMAHSPELISSTFFDGHSERISRNKFEDLVGATRYTESWNYMFDPEQGW